MSSRMPRWLLIALIAVGAVIVLGGICVGLYYLIAHFPLAGWIVTGVLVGLLAAVLIVTLPPLVRLYRFQRYFKSYEGQLRSLPALMSAGRTQEALLRFDGVMKRAPENAYLYYLQAFFLQAAGKLREAVGAANKALAMSNRDPFLPAILKQVGGQMGQPGTVAEFKEQLEDLRASLEPRVAQMRERREKAVVKRQKKRKSR